MRFPKNQFKFLESRFWFIAVPAENRPSFGRLKGNLACLATFAARCIIHGPVSAFKSHIFTFFYFRCKSYRIYIQDKILQFCPSTAQCRGSYMSGSYETNISGINGHRINKGIGGIKK
jgi:hypothetical protein